MTSSGLTLISFTLPPSPPSLRRRGCRATDDRQWPVSAAWRVPSTEVSTTEWCAHGDDRLSVAPEFRDDRLGVSDTADHADYDFRGLTVLDLDPVAHASTMSLVAGSDAAVAATPRLVIRVLGVASSTAGRACRCCRVPGDRRRPRRRSTHGAERPAWLAVRRAAAATGSKSSQSSFHMTTSPSITVSFGIRGRPLGRASRGSRFWRRALPNCADDTSDLCRSGVVHVDDHHGMHLLVAGHWYSFPTYLLRTARSAAPENIYHPGCTGAVSLPCLIHQEAG
jgi:hypothetical protein